MSRPRRPRRRWLPAALLAIGVALPARPAAAADLEGRIALAIPGLALEKLGPVVVYLEPDGRPAPGGAPGAALEVRQKDARFSPPFLAVAAGQDVSMPNDDSIYHNVFSFSAPNAFDLGLYPAGQARTVRFEHPGVVQIYCSIHESMNGTIFVAPTRWFTVAAPDGAFAIPGVPEGSWVLRTWSATLPASERHLALGPGRTRVEVALGER